jgi:hypothetical protein
MLQSWRLLTYDRSQLWRWHSQERPSIFFNISMLCFIAWVRDLNALWVHWDPILLQIISVNCDTQGAPHVHVEFPLEKNITYFEKNWNFKVVLTETPLAKRQDQDNSNLLNVAEINRLSHSTNPEKIINAAKDLMRNPQELVEYSNFKEQTFNLQTGHFWPSLMIISDCTLDAFLLRTIQFIYIHLLTNSYLVLSSDIKYNEADSKKNPKKS